MSSIFLLYIMFLKHMVNVFMTKLHVYMVRIKNVQFANLFKKRKKNYVVSIIFRMVEIYKSRPRKVPSLEAIDKNFILYREMTYEALSHRYHRTRSIIILI